MDLMDLKPTSDTVDVLLKHPTTFEPLNNEDGSQTNKRIKKAQGKKKVEFTSEDLEEATLELLAKATKGWKITYGGVKPQFSVPKAKEVYAEVFWIKDQIEEAVADSLDFTKP